MCGRRQAILGVPFWGKAVDEVLQAKEEGKARVLHPTIQPRPGICLPTGPVFLRHTRRRAKAVTSGLSASSDFQ